MNWAADPMKCSTCRVRAKSRRFRVHADAAEDLLDHAGVRCAGRRARRYPEQVQFGQVAVKTPARAVPALGDPITDTEEMGLPDGMR